MSFNNWLIRFTRTNELFPHQYIKKDTYKSTDLQRSEIKAYRDNNNYLHRVTSPNYKTKIEFQTYKLSLAQLSEIQSKLNAAMDNAQQRRLQLTYWDNELLDYRTSTFYMPDKTYNIIMFGGGDIQYSPLTFTFIEY